MSFLKYLRSGVARRIISFLARHDRLRRAAKRVSYRFPWVKQAMLSFAGNASRNSRYYQISQKAGGTANLSEPARIIYSWLVRAYRMRGLRKN
jgi:hypothetical protein